MAALREIPNLSRFRTAVRLKSWRCASGNPAFGLPLDASDETVKTTAMRRAALKRWRKVKAEAIKRARQADRYVNTGSVNGWEEIKSPLPSRGYQGGD